jgi:hypothetical protein
MALQYSAALRNNQLDQIQATVSTGGHLAIFVGSPPANCATATTGATLVDITLPSTFMAAGSGGSAAKTGTWSVTASGTGTAGYYRIFSSGTLSGACIVQGTVTATGGGGDMTLDNVSIASGQTVTISTYTITAGNA